MIGIVDRGVSTRRSWNFLNKKPAEAGCLISPIGVCLIARRLAVRQGVAESFDSRVIGVQDSEVAQVISRARRDLGPKSLHQSEPYGALDARQSVYLLVNVLLVRHVESFH